MDPLRYPIGRFDATQSITADKRRQWIADLASAPARLATAVAGLTVEQLDTPYRPGGWSVRQVVHHLPDSHMVSYVRFKLALTEDEPLIKPYLEDRWAELADYRLTPIETSLTLFEAVQERWVILLQAMSPQDFLRTMRHPETGPRTLEVALGVYAWHARHHVAQITSLRERMGW